MDGLVRNTLRTSPARLVHGDLYSRSNVIPEDFFKTCELLLNYDEEPNRRTIVGRAYYAAFLNFREYLKRHGLTKTQAKREVHEFVIQCLGFSNVPEASTASAQLKDLQQRRHDADYNLDCQVNRAHAEDALYLGKTVVASFEKIPPQTAAEIIKKASQHARMKNWIV